MILTMDNIHESWLEFMDYHKNDMEKIWAYIQENGPYTPNRQDIFKFMEQDIKRAKIVIIGQDPYPEEGRATGRAFEVAGLNHWYDPFRQVSLKNIVRLLHYTFSLPDYPQDAISEEEKQKERLQNFRKGYPLPFQTIREKIRDGEFSITPPNLIFKKWESQGVILLNKYLTCKIGEPRTHRVVWEFFTDEVIRYMAGQQKDLIWFLWGKDARKMLPLFERNNKDCVFASRHPMICSDRYEDDFLRNRCFLETKHLVDWL